MNDKKYNPSSYMSSDLLEMATKAAKKDDDRSLASFIRSAVREKAEKVLGVKK